MSDFDLRVQVAACERTFTVHCPTGHVAGLVAEAFGGLLRSGTPDRNGSSCSCRIELTGDGLYLLHDFSGGTSCLDDADSLLFHLDKSLILSLQRQRPDLFFLHAAVVAFEGRVAVLAAPPGTGKSTFTLALSEAGFAYLSDELAPIDVCRFLVHPYPRALCLKGLPPAPLRLPPGALVTTSRAHVPAVMLGEGLFVEPLPVSAFVFLRRSGQPSDCRRIGAARAAARLLANSLNSLAHPQDGVAPAAQLAERLPSFELEIGDLQAASQEMIRILSLDSAGVSDGKST